MSWTPKLFGLLLFFFFFGFKGCNSTNLTHASSGPTKANPKGKVVDSVNIICNPPFHPVGDTCLLIDRDMRGTWSDMRDFCQYIGGDLVNLQDANILYEISQYIKLKGMGDVSYWVGATDEAEEGKWVWSSDGTTVRRSPLWGRLYGYQPDGREDENCGVLNDRDFFYLHDESCEDSTYGVICQPTDSGELKPNGDGEINTLFNEPTNECPDSYERVGNACLRVYPEQNYTWYEGKDLCEDGPHSHLVKIDDANFLGEIFDYLIEKEINAYMWIGGTDEASEGEWVWHDVTTIKCGTPFWDVNGEGLQEPDSGTNTNCNYIHDGILCHFRDLPCKAKRGVLCEYDL